MSLMLFGKKEYSFFTIVSLLFWSLHLQVRFIFVFSFLNSAPYVPAHILDTPARAASDPSEETLHWEGDPDQCSTVSAAHQTQLQVSGEAEHPQSSS